MSGPHGPSGHLLHVPGDSPLHRAAAHRKVLAVLGFTLVVVALPRTAWWAYAAALGVVAVAARVGRVPWRHLLPRLVVETPVVVFCLLLPFVATGPRTDVLGLSLSVEGLTGAGALLAKATLGVLASLLLAATTTVPELLRGLQRLRLPDPLVEITGFMVRYLEIVVDDLRRMHRALTARGLDARSPRHWPVLARTAGALFVRTYERGERVHLAMLARGYTGRLP